MKRLAGILSEFLETDPYDVGPLTFGGGVGDEVRRAKPKIPSAALMDRLAERLERQVGFNKRIIVAIIAIYGLAFAGSSALVIVHHNDIGWIEAFVGGNVLGLTGVGSKLLDLWREKIYADALLALLPTLTPAEAARMLEAFYLEKIRKSPRKAPKVAFGGRA
jgi:hypothetical protein